MNTNTTQGNTPKMDTTVNVTQQPAPTMKNGLDGITSRDIDAMNVALVMASTISDVNAGLKDLTIPDTTAPVVAFDENITTEQAVAAQALVAEQLLETNGWAIVNKLAFTIAELIQTTQMFVVPVCQNLEEIKAKLGAAGDEYAVRFDTLRHDIADIVELLMALSKKHSARSGAVALEDLSLVLELTTAYSNIQSQVETKVGPEMLAQFTFLEESGIDADFLYAQFTATQTAE